MKIFITFLISIIMCFCACKSKTNLKSNTVIEGKLEDKEDGYYYLITSENALDYDNYYKALDSFKIDSNGRFSINIALDFADFFQIRKPNGQILLFNKDLYLKPNDTLDIFVPQKHTDTTVLKGTAAFINQIQWDLDALQFDGEEEEENYNNRLTKDPDEYLNLIKKYKLKEENYVLQYFSDDQNNVEYIDYINAKIKCKWMNDIWSFLKYHNYYAHDEWKYLPIDSLDRNIIDKWKPSSKFHFLENYGKYIFEYVNSLYQDQIKGKNDSLIWVNEFNDKFSIIKENLTGMDHDLCLSMLSNNFWVYYKLMQHEFYDQANLVDKYFAKNNQSDKYYGLFNQKYNRYLKIAPGQPAPNFTLKDTSGNNVALNDFIGKVVYVDFWATWCGPCVASIPKHLELQKSLKGRNVVFLYIALESGEKEINHWKSYLSEKNWPGIHVVAEDQFRNVELKPYLLRAIPTYLLIDQEGKLISGSAKGPERILPEIKKLLD